MYTQEITITVHRPAYTRKRRKPSSLPQMMTAAACLVLAIATVILSTPDVHHVAGSGKQISDASAAHIQILESQAVSYEAAQEPAVDAQSGNFYEVPACDTSFKSFMDWRTITSPTSKQWEIQNSEYTWTDQNGFRRYGDCYLVALGTFYSTTCGDIFEITLDSGKCFLAMTGDIKADEHTDAKHQLRVVGNTKNLVEFIVDTDVIPASCWQTGDMSYAADRLMAGNIISIERMN